jgi:uncharacterized protein YbbC (DUF1343 family)
MTAVNSLGSVRLGIEVLLDDQARLLHGRRVGVLSGPSGVLPNLRSSVEALIATGTVKALFAPEHGLLGAAAPGAEIDDELHLSGIPIYSFYGASQAPSVEQLRDLDVIVCDVQDVGCRFYTYVWTIVLLMQAAAQAGVSVIVVDRPNPLGPFVEGPGLDEGIRSLVGLHDVPVRHGLTIGEMALLAQRELAIDCDLTVVPCEGWQREMAWPSFLPWVAPSPNMPTLSTVAVYPGTCLLEGVNVSVGRGCSMPFEWQGAPWIDGPALAAELNALNLPGVRWRAHAFEPWLDPFAKTVCFGAQPHVTDARVFRPVLSGVAQCCAIWQMGQRLADHPVAWLAEHFDRLVGNTQWRAAIEAGVSAMELAKPWAQYERDFCERADSVLKYGPLIAHSPEVY